MHESAIVSELLATVVRHAADRPVREIRARVGLLTGVSPDAMQFYFEVMRDETVGSQARLIVDLVPLRAACRACGTPEILESVRWDCPRCGSDLAFDNGDELSLSQVTVDDGRADHDRTEDPQEER